MHFTYRDIPDDDLQQGDILEKTDQLKSLIQHYFPYYASQTEYTHFIVLTQSCDLDRRDGQNCNAEYINLAVIKPIFVYINRLIKSYQESNISLDFPVCTDKSKTKIMEQLQRLLDNNESESFFLKAEPTKNFPDDACAYLKLSIALHANEHYETCLKSRIIQLDPAFQAKLGWLIGQMYSRVGTRDWVNSEKTQRIRDALLEQKVYWVPTTVLKEFYEVIAQYLSDNPGQMPDGEVLDGLIKKIPTQNEKVIKRLKELLGNDKDISSLKGNGVMNDEIIDRIIKRFDSDKILTNLIKKT